MLRSERFNALQRIRAEFTNFHNNINPNLMINVGMPDLSNFFIWNAVIAAPPDTLYGGGLFHLIINFPENYPMSPPKIKFKTPIYHINVKSERDSINVDEIGTPDLRILQLWKPEYNVKDILTSVYALFYMNNTNSPYNMNMVEEYLNNRELYKQKTRYFAQKYASPDRFDNTNIWDFTYVA